MEEKLKEYIAENIFPLYERYYSHGMIHIENAIKNCLFLADYYKLNRDMAYVIGAYHDLGLKVDRKNHEIESGKILEQDIELKKYFSKEQIMTMKVAVEDHRGSRKECPRNKYGEILSDSDRDFDIEILVKRQLSTSIKNYPEFTTFEEHFENCYQYMLKRINQSGHFNLWTNNPILIKRRAKFEKQYLDREYAKSVYKAEYERISKNGTIEKIKNYYLDY